MENFEKKFLEKEKKNDGQITRFEDNCMGIGTDTMWSQ